MSQTSGTSPHDSIGSVLRNLAEEDAAAEEFGRMSVTPAAERSCLIVLGMHRSGTSAITGTLAMLGAELPPNLLGPTDSNPKGHFESMRVLELSEDLLRESQSAWYDFRVLDSMTLAAQPGQNFSARLKEVIQNVYRKCSLLVVKDPRFCRFLPLVRSTIEDCGAAARVVFCFRNPLEVAMSLQSRDDISHSHGLGLWLRHMLDGEFYSRGMRRVFIYFPEFLNNWRAAIDQIELSLGISFPDRLTVAPEIDKFLDAKLRHHTDSVLDDNWVGPCFEAVCVLVRDPDDATAMRRLDSIRDKFEQHANIFGPAIQDYYRNVLHLRRELEAREVRTQGQESELVTVRRALEATAIQLQGQESELVTVRRALEATAIQLQGKESELVTVRRALEAKAIQLQGKESERALQQEKFNHDVALLNQRLQDSEGKMASLKRKHSDVRSQLRAIRRSRSWKITGPLRMAASSLRRLAASARRFCRVRSLGAKR